MEQFGTALDGSLRFKQELYCLVLSVPRYEFLAVENGLAVVRRAAALVDDIEATELVDLYFARLCCMLLVR